jgi:hypothetical protein
MQTQPKRRPHLRALVKYLVDHRSQTPNAFLYEALITTNWETAGSANEVRQILNEMRDLGVATTSSLYHSALRALAVHPDYLLRNRIITEMKERWLEITPEGRYSIALGLLRDGQHELALDSLEQLLDSPQPVPSWVTDIFIVVLTQHNHFDEAVALLQRRSQSGPSSVSPNIWSLVLDECSRYYHYAGTRLAWDTLVPTKLLTPSDGTCLNVLNTASRHSDARLATDVISHLSARQAKLGAHHYEALVDCYAHRDDVSNALHSLCIMARAGVAPVQASTASVLAALRRNPTLARVGRDALLRLAETFTVPLAAFNVVLDGLCASGVGGADHDGAGGALELYQQVRHVCGCGPDHATFRPLMERAWDVGVAKFLVDEMRAFGVEPTREFYDRLVYVAAVEDDLDTAFQALAELEGEAGGVKGRGKGADEWVGRETALAVVRRCVADRDERVWNLLWFAKRIGLDLGPAGTALAESLEGLKEEWKRDSTRRKRAEEDEPAKEVGDRKEVEREVPPWLGNAFFAERGTGGDAGTA